MSCSERGGSEQFKMKIYVSSGIRTRNALYTNNRSIALKLDDWQLTYLFRIMFYLALNRNCKV